MKIASIQNSSQRMIEDLAYLLRRKGYKNVGLSYSNGAVFAEKRVQWFGKRAEIIISVTDLKDKAGKKIMIRVNGNERRYDEALNIYESLEEKISDLIYDHF